MTQESQAVGGSGSARTRAGAWTWTGRHGAPFPSCSRSAARVRQVVLAGWAAGRRVTHLDALAAAAEVGKEHERAPLLFDLAEEVALRAGDEADGLGGHLDDGQVVVLVVVVLDGHRADALRHDALDVPAQAE